MDQLPNILWAYRTTKRIATKETPYSLAFGVVAVLPIELKLPSFRTQLYNLEDNEDKLKACLDLLEEK